MGADRPAGARSVRAAARSRSAQSAALAHVAAAAAGAASGRPARFAPIPPGAGLPASIPATPARSSSPSAQPRRRPWRRSSRVLTAPAAGRARLALSIPGAAFGCLGADPRPDHRQQFRVAADAGRAAGRARPDPQAAEEAQGASGDPDDPYAPLGIRAGAFDLFPAVELIGGYDSNPGADAGRQRRLRSTPSRRNCGCNRTGRAMSSRPNCAAATPAISPTQTPTLSRPYFNGKVDGRIDVTQRHPHRSGKRALLVSTDNPGSPNLQAGLAKLPVFTTFGGIAGLGAALQPLRTVGQRRRRAHRLSGLRAHRRHDGQQRRPQLQPIQRHVARQLRADARGQALRRGERSTPAVHDLELDFFGFQRNSNGIDRQGRLDLRADAPAHRRGRARLHQAQLRGRRGSRRSPA